MKTELSAQLGDEESGGKPKQTTEPPPPTPSKMPPFAPSKNAVRELMVDATTNKGSASKDNGDGEGEGEDDEKPKSDGIAVVNQAQTPGLGSGLDDLMQFYPDTSPDSDALGGSAPGADGLTSTNNAGKRDQLLLVMAEKRATLNKLPPSDVQQRRELQTELDLLESDLNYLEKLTPVPTTPAPAPGPMKGRKPRTALRTPLSPLSPNVVRK